MHARVLELCVCFLIPKHNPIWVYLKSIEHLLNRRLFRGSWHTLLGLEPSQKNLHMQLGSMYVIGCQLTACITFLYIISRACESIFPTISQVSIEEIWLNVWFGFRETSPETVQGIVRGYGRGKKRFLYVHSFYLTEEIRNGPFSWWLWWLQMIVRGRPLCGRRVHRCSRFLKGIWCILYQESLTNPFATKNIQDSCDREICIWCCKSPVWRMAVHPECRFPEGLDAHLCVAESGYTWPNPGIVVA